jgi:2-methylisocitrate lyase-like PEP mutase family enzyme
MYSKGEELKKLIAAPQITIQPGVFNGFSARLVESLGYKSAIITGSGVSENFLGWADMGVMGLEDNVRVSRALAECTNLLLLGDGDTGYGNPVNVFFTIRALEGAGLAGAMIEDQIWPKRCGHMAGKELISAEEMVEKIKAGCEGRRDPAFVIKARTDAAGPLGIAEAIKRLNMYAEAGADLLLADAVLTTEDIGTLARNVTKPLSVNMGFGISRRKTTPLHSPRQLQDVGVAVAAYPRMLTSAALRGMMNAMKAFHQSVETGEVVDRPDLTVTFEELNELMGFSFLTDLERRHLSRSQLDSKYGQAARRPRETV